jgi:hypothetical protein
MHQKQYKSLAPSFRDAPLGADPESQDSGSGPRRKIDINFIALDHPGMTAEVRKDKS